MIHVMPKPLLLSYQLRKIYLHFQNKKYLMKSGTFDSKSFTTFPSTTIHPQLSYHAFK